MKIAYAASEVVPFAKTGGLADVSGTLPRELEKLGHDVKVFMPKYSSVKEKNYALQLLEWASPMSIRIAGVVHEVNIYKSLLPKSKVEIYFLDCPYFFHRHNLYTDEPDEDQRFICFAKSVIETLQRLQWAPDVIHCNDWQTGLIPLYIKENYSWDKLFENTSTLFTIHNIGYQGKFSTQTLLNAEIDADLFYNGGKIEHEGLVNFLKTGISFTDVINTVSETYSKELLTPEYSYGMEKVLQYRNEDFYGILNGVDYTIWNPETDAHIFQNYSSKDLSKKEKNKELLLKQFSIDYKKNIPLIGIVSRFAIQKGFDLIQEALPALMELEAQWIILGSGEKEYENAFLALREQMSDKVGVHIGYSEDLAHKIEAGADIFLMPSHYEPCGLNQIYSLKYGTVPVVRKTGGLADTVQDWNEYNQTGMDIGNGFSFVNYNADALLNAVERSINDYHNKSVWRKIQLNGMSKDFSWTNSAKAYEELYKKAVSKNNK
jgi:starch synthase